MLRLRLCTAALLFAASAGHSNAQPSNAQAALDPAAVEAFVDAAMADSLAKSYAPGVIVTVAQGDRLLLAKGYGVRDLKTRAPIDPAHTLYRIGSITKLFTTVIALRLAERGRLDLDADVNNYLTRVKVPTTYPEPVTARRLMTHHGGFDVAVLYVGSPTERQAQETPQQMSWDLVRARPVTALPIYCNMCFGVLGLEVSDILGTTYREAVRQEIFLPLGMDQSVSGLPDERVADVAQAYMRNDQWQVSPIPQMVMWTSAQGGGDISSTAVDMAKFLSAMLSPGKLLQPASLASMTNVDTWRFNPRVPGLGLTLWQYFYHGHPAQGHRGEINGFISRIAWFREANIGVFISVGSTVQTWPEPRLSSIFGHHPPSIPPPGARTLDPDHLITGFLDGFADRFLPPLPPPPAVVPASASEPTVEAFAGTYFRLDASTYLLAKIISTLFGEQLTALPGGQFAAGGCRPFVRKAPLYYECNSGKGEPIGLAFRVDDGRIYVGDEPVNALELQPWWRTAPYAVWPIPILTLLGLSAFLALIGTSDPRRRTILKLTGAGAALFLIALPLELQFAYDLHHSRLHELPILWRLLFPLAAALLLASAALSWPVLQRGGTHGGGLRLVVVSYHAILVLGSLGLIWLILLWGLIWPFR